MHLRSIATSWAAFAVGVLSFAGLASVAGLAPASASPAAGAAPASAPPAAGAAPAASAECGASCFDLSSLALGPGQVQRHSGPGAGLFLKPGSTAGPAEDFTSETVGTLGALCAAGEIPAGAYVCGNPGGQFPPSQVVREWNWAPAGNESGSCEGVASERTGQPVILQKCGRAAATDLWVPDFGRGTGRGACLTGRYCPWYSAAASKPLVLRVKTSGPVGQLVIWLSTGTATAPERQLFCTVPGPYAPSC
jgi:hypothetical protein